MKIMIMFLAILIFLSPVSFAATNRPSALALEWWLRGQNKVIGAEVCTKQRQDRKFEITCWDANGVSQPTNAELDIIIDGYEAFLASEDIRKRGRLTALKARLNLNDEDLNLIRHGL